MSDEYELSETDKIKLKNYLKLPLEEVIKIQEALKPLGYLVYGYKQEDVQRKIILYVESDFPFVKV